MLVPNPSGVSMDPTDGLSRGRSSVGNPPAANQENTDLYTVHSEDSSQPSDENPTIVTLDIGGQRFKTTTATLCEQSGLFRYQLSDESSWSPQRNGSYFVDADPVIFEHLLRFMQRPSVFPVFYDSVRGYDYALYGRLQAEANHFQVDTLRDWIKEKKYLRAVMVKTDTPVVSALAQLAPETNTGNVVYERHVVPRTKKVYLCPRQISVHRGHPEMCGAACHKRQAENTVEYDEETYLEVLSIRKEVVFDESAYILS